ncbi:hypothetical protein Scel_19160 [Streptomyces cellostaticus]|nr:hypothetical protein Scel_19160 [Streptomyces cellostaticus]
MTSACPPTPAAVPAHGTELGAYRWVIERNFASLPGFGHLRIRWKQRADIHEALLKLACCLITHRQRGSLRQRLLGQCDRGTYD